MLDTPTYLLKVGMIVYSDVTLPTDRKFGVFFGVLFFLASFVFLIMSQISLAAFLGVASLVLLVLSACKPSLLHPMNRAWMLFGLTLGRIVNPIVMGLIFYLIFVPTALVLKIFGRDELRLKIKSRETYWKLRPAEHERQDPFRQQF
jgi:hypothetical protein